MNKKTISIIALTILVIIILVSIYFIFLQEAFANLIIAKGCTETEAGKIKCTQIDTGRPDGYIDQYEFSISARDINWKTLTVNKLSNIQGWEGVYNNNKYIIKPGSEAENKLIQLGFEIKTTDNMNCKDWGYPIALLPGPTTDANSCECVGSCSGADSCRTQFGDRYRVTGCKGYNAICGIIPEGSCSYIESLFTDDSIYAKLYTGTQCKVETSLGDLYGTFIPQGQPTCTVQDSAWTEAMKANIKQGDYGFVQIKTLQLNYQEEQIIKCIEGTQEKLKKDKKTIQIKTCTNNDWVATEQKCSLGVKEDSGDLSCRELKTYLIPAIVTLFVIGLGIATFIIIKKKKRGRKK